MPHFENTIVDTFTDGALSAILFAESPLSCDESGDGRDTSLESLGYSSCDFSTESREALWRECAQFIWQNRRELRAAIALGEDWERLGADFYFTRAGHGVGYWSSGLGEIGDRLSEACRCSRREFICFLSDDACEIILQ
jgi:hypothetical protein